MNTRFKVSDIGPPPIQEGGGGVVGGQTDGTARDGIRNDLPLNALLNNST